MRVTEGQATLVRRLSTDLVLEYDANELVPSSEMPAMFTRLNSLLIFCALGFSLCAPAQAAEKCGEREIFWLGFLMLRKRRCDIL